MASVEHQRLLREAAAGETVEDKVLAKPPNWSSVLPQHGFLKKLADADADAQLRLLEENDASGALVAALRLPGHGDDSPAVYLLTLLGELVRTNAAAYQVFVGAIKRGTDLCTPLEDFLSASDVSAHGADRAAYLLTAMHWQSGRASEAALQSTIQRLVSGKYPVSEVGLLDALVNLLKNPELRQSTWSQAGVQSKILSFGPDSPPPVIYKCIFALWMVSCDSALFADLKKLGAVNQIKKAIAGSRTEKVVRVGLLALKNFLADGEMAEDVVEAGALEAVEALEYEKWRDAEVYDSIRGVAKSVASAQHKHSNFARYERELQKSTLSRGFIHTEKFWVDNYLQFEKDEFRAIKKLVDILCASSDPTTLAVACHDLGEFARLHPQGKIVLARVPRAKARAMECMHNDDREVAREALLCVQKLMLNRWQDCAAGVAA